MKKDHTQEQRRLIMKDKIKKFLKSILILILLGIIFVIYYKVKYN